MTRGPRKFWSDCKEVQRTCYWWRYTIRYDTRCYFNVRSKADISQLNLPLWRRAAACRVWPHPWFWCGRRQVSCVWRRRFQLRNDSRHHRHRPAERRRLYADSLELVKQFSVSPMVSFRAEAVVVYCCLTRVLFATVRANMAHLRLAWYVCKFAGFCRFMGCTVKKNWAAALDCRIFRTPKPISTNLRLRIGNFKI